MSRADQQKSPDDKSTRIDTRFEPKDRALVERAASAAGLPVSAFVRGAVVDEARKRLGYGTEEGAQVAMPPKLSPEDRATLDAARGEVKRVGVLLNQQTRLAHRGVIDLGALAPLIEGLAQQQDDLIELLGGSTS